MTDQMIIGRSEDTCFDILLDQIKKTEQEKRVFHYHSIEVHNSEIQGNDGFCCFCDSGSVVVHRCLLERDSVDFGFLRKKLYYGDRML